MGRGVGCSPALDSLSCPEPGAWVCCLPPGVFLSGELVLQMVVEGVLEVPTPLVGLPDLDGNFQLQEPSLGSQIFGHLTL